MTWILKCIYKFSLRFQSTRAWDRRSSCSSRHEAMFHLLYKFCAQPNLKRKKYHLESMILYQIPVVYFRLKETRIMSIIQKINHLKKYESSIGKFIQFLSVFTYCFRHQLINFLLSWTYSTNINLILHFSEIFRECIFKIILLFILWS